MREELPEELVARLHETLQTKDHTEGKTHNFYHYPARLPPDVARLVVDTMSQPEEWVLDPFMGGGTTIIEALAAGRSALGVDLNSLAAFVTDVRTTPLSPEDEATLRGWAMHCAYVLPLMDARNLTSDTRVRNLPKAVEMFTVGALRLAEHRLTFPRQRNFARCALLRLGQWALDCRDFDAPRRKRLARHFVGLVDEMLEGLQEFVSECATNGVPKNRITARRLLLNRSAVGLENDPAVRELAVRPRLVFTSPPYPSVHVLYHRWQYRGRKETAAPYWIADVQDGAGEAYYTGGSRTPTGLRNYFAMITAAFKSVRSVIADDGLVVQLIGFSDIATQLPRYLQAMEEAGFSEVPVSHPTGKRLRRRVANRKWYAKLQEKADASSELLLIHAPHASGAPQLTPPSAEASTEGTSTEGQ